MSSPPTWTYRPTARRPTTCRSPRCVGPISPTNLLQAVSPAAIIHLAAIIPPACYARPGLARRVNVDATGLLIDAAAALPNPPRFVQASSVAAYGARNPHPLGDLLTADTPLRSSDVYGVHQMEAENLLRASRLDWVILRLGGVRTAERMGWSNRCQVDRSQYRCLRARLRSGTLPTRNRVTVGEMTSTQRRGP
jgi:dTDP-4-dehydrorhamnose reductase